MISHHHAWIDNSLLSYHKKFPPDWTKNRMSIHGIIDILRTILAYNLAKYQYFAEFLQTFCGNSAKNFWKPNSKIRLI